MINEDPANNDDAALQYSAWRTLVLLEAEHPVLPSTTDLADLSGPILPNRCTSCGEAHSGECIELRSGLLRYLALPDNQNKFSQSAIVEFSRLTACPKLTPRRPHMVGAFLAVLAAFSVGLSGGLGGQDDLFALFGEEGEHGLMSATGSSRITTHDIHQYFVFSDRPLEQRLSCGATS